jgi:hypothetical protein
MSIHAAVRRWGVPGFTLAVLVFPLLVAGCPWDDLPEDAPFWFAFPDVPDSCKACYADVMGIDWEPGDEDDLQEDPTFFGTPDTGAGQTIGGPPPGEGRDEPGAESEDEVEARRGLPPTGVPEAVKRPRVDPDLRNVPQTGYPKPPSSPSSKY